MHVKRLVTPLLAVALWASGCAEQPVTFGALFSSPTGIAVAGTTPASRYIFVANGGEDALQVLTLGTNLNEIGFVPSPAQYFPLRVPAGPSPSELVATFDKRFVVVLNEASDSLGLIDADSQSQVHNQEGNDAGKPHRLVFGTGGRPTAMVAATTPCADCAGLIYVTLAGMAAIAEVAVIDYGEEASQSGELELRRLLAVGGEPLEISISRKGDLLYATDAQNPEVIRVHIATGTVDRQNIGGIGGPLAVSQDGTLLVVGRPALRDLVVLDHADHSAFALYDANPKWAPWPVCVSPCDDLAVCSPPSHPADAAICRRDNAPQKVPGATDYQAIFLNVPPAEIVTLGSEEEGSNEEDRTLHAGECTAVDETEAQEPEEYGQYAVVATTNGLLWFLALRREKSATEDLGEMAVGLLDDTWCQHPEATVEDAGTMEDLTLSQFLAPCPQLPPNRQRFACASNHVVVMPGATGVKFVRLAWEDVVVDRSTGGGELTSEGQFTDNGVNLSAEDIRIGDILEVLSEPSADADCVAVLGDDPAPCELERWITDIQVVPPNDVNAAGTLRLSLDQELPAVCFGSGGAIAYRIRAGAVFRVAPVGVNSNTGYFEVQGRYERISPGDWVGPFAADKGRDYRIGFGLLGPEVLDTQKNASPCQRHDLPPPLVRDSSILFFASDHFNAVRLADSNLVAVPSLPSGYIPTSMIVETVGGEDTEGEDTGDGERTVFVTFAASGPARLLSEPPLEGFMALAPAKLYERNASKFE